MRLGRQLGKHAFRDVAGTGEPGATRGWFVHDRGCDGCASRFGESEAIGGAVDLRAGADGLVVLERQRRLCDCVQHGVRPAGSTRRDGPATRTVLPTDDLSPLFQAVLEATEEAVDNAHAQGDDDDGARRADGGGVAGGESEGVAGEVMARGGGATSTARFTGRGTRSHLRKSSLATLGQRVRMSSGDLAARGSPNAPAVHAQQNTQATQQSLGSEELSAKARGE